MQKEYAELFSAFTQFRKLHMSDLFPNMNHSEFATLMHIGGANKCLNEEKVKVSTLSERMRTVSAQDRRITYVELTPEGAEVLAEAEETMNTFTAKVLSSLKKEDVIRLTALMNQLYEASEAEIEKRKKKGDVTE